MSSFSYKGSFTMTMSRYEDFRSMNNTDKQDSR